MTWKQAYDSFMQIDIGKQSLGVDYKLIKKETDQTEKICHGHEFWPLHTNKNMMSKQQYNNQIHSSFR